MYSVFSGSHYKVERPKVEDSVGSKNVIGQIVGTFDKNRLDKKMVSGLKKCGFSEEYCVRVSRKLPELILKMRLVGFPVDAETFLSTENGDIVLRSGQAPLFVRDSETLLHLATIFQDFYENIELLFEYHSETVRARQRGFEPGQYKVEGICHMFFSDSQTRPNLIDRITAPDGNCIRKMSSDHLNHTCKHDARFFIEARKLLGMKDVSTYPL